MFNLISDNQQSYTIFVARDFAIASMLPQDVGDPIYSDAELRRDILLGHITRQLLSTDDLLQRSIVVMANNETAQISSKGGESCLKFNFNFVYRCFAIYRCWPDQRSDNIGIDSYANSGQYLLHQ